MTYKTILVHVAPGPEALGRIRLAARLARAMQAHLIGSAPTGVSRYTPEATRALLAAPCAALRDAAQRALALFERLAFEEGAQSVETRLADDETGVALALDARYCDLVVIGGAGGDPTPLRPPDLAHYLVLAAGRPVLVVPAAGETALPGGAALVAWNASTQATRALDGALPLLRAAHHAIVLVLGSGAVDGGESGPRLAAFLQRHGIATRTALRPATADTGAALLAEADRCGASLLVMGAYGHARWHEALFRGASVTVLRHPPCPILLAH